MWLPGASREGDAGATGAGRAPEDGDAWIKWSLLEYCYAEGLGHLWLRWFPAYQVTSTAFGGTCVFLDGFPSRALAILTLVNYSQREHIHTASSHTRLCCQINPNLLQRWRNGVWGRESSEGLSRWPGKGMEGEQAQGRGSTSHQHWSTFLRGK